MSYAPSVYTTSYHPITGRRRYRNFSAFLRAQSQREDLVGDLHRFTDTTMHAIPAFSAKSLRSLCAQVPEMADALVIAEREWKAQR